jgi:predicted PurR-regulated permease PerM
VPKAVAIIIVLLVVIVFGLILAVLIGNSVSDFTRAWPTYQDNFMKMVSRTISYLNAEGVEIPRETVLQMLNPGEIMNMIGSMLTTLTSMLSDAVLILITVVFILLEAAGLPAKITAVWGRDSTTMEDLNEFAKIMQKYIALKTGVSLITGLIIGFAMMVVGIDFALLWGLLAFLLNYVPTIGSLIAAIPPTILAFIQFGWVQALIVLSIFLVINMTIGNVIEPRAMGRSLGLSTLIVFVSLVFWGWVLGPVGMLLSVPLTMSVKLYLESRAGTQWIAIMLGAPVGREKSSTRKKLKS